MANRIAQNVAHRFYYTANLESKKVALVTGGNRGIGEAIVKGLCNEFDGDVVIGARASPSVYAAIKRLTAEGYSVRYANLDITDMKTILATRDWLSQYYEGLDVLVNNAATMYRVFDAQVSFPEAVRKTISVNYFGTLNVSQELLPILKPHARVCNMSSLAGINCLQLIHPRLQERLLDPSLTMTELSHIMEDYIKAAEGEEEDSGYVMSPMGAYGMSKIGVTIMTYIQQRSFDMIDQLSVERGGKCIDIVVNSCSPGYVMTDRTYGRGELSAEGGAATPLWLCQLPPFVKSPRGELVRGNKVISLYDMVTNKSNPLLRGMINFAHEGKDS